MRKQLCIALISPSKALTSILDTIGVWYHTELSMPLIPQNYPLLILEKKPHLNSLIQDIQNYLDQGGIILEITTHPNYYTKSVIQKYISRVINTSNEYGFDRISFLDLYSKVALSKNRTLFNGLIDIDYSPKANKIAFIGLDLPKLAANQKYCRKRFHSPYGQNPDEIVSSVQRDGVCDLVELSIQHIFLEQNLPFLKKWHSPTKNPVFSFRIDTDYGSQESLLEIYSLLSTHQLKATWFLHVEAHENWLDFFKSFKNQELALHGYKHGYSSSSNKIERNINEGLKLLNDAEITVEGYCVPYAIWNKGLQNTLTKFDFLYSSEFTRSYDALPFYDENNHLQIPIHPICTGSFSRIRYPEENIRQYFKYILDQKIQLWKPVIFYHHPLQYALSIFDDVFNSVNDSQLNNLTFTEFAHFWNRRKSTEVNFFLKDDVLHIESNNSDLPIYVSKTLNGFTLIKANIEIPITDITSTFKYDTSSLPSAVEIEELSENKLQLIKTSLIDWKNRFHL